MPFEAEGQVVRAEGDVVDPWTVRQATGVCYGFDGFELDRQHRIVVPPLCIFEPGRSVVERPRHSGSLYASPASSAHRAVVEVLQGLVDRFFCQDLGNHDRGETEVAEPTDEVGMSGVGQAHLRLDPQLLCDGTELDDLVVADRLVLTVEVDGIVVAASERDLQLALGDIQRRGEQDDFILLLERLLEWLFQWVSSTFNRC